MINLKVILGSTREGRSGEKVFNWVKQQLKGNLDLNIEFVDLKNWQLPYFNEPIAPGDPNFKQPSKKLQRWEDKINYADAFLILTPEYNHSFPAVLKSALDATYKPWNRKPVGFIAWGGVGGARSVEQLRLVSVQLDMAPIRNAIHIMKVWELFDEAGNINSASDAKKYSQMLDSMLSDLIWWANALKNARLGNNIILKENLEKKNLGFVAIA